jgi:hypothetical protein
MKKLIFLFILASSLSVKSQVFIGKTQNEIESFNERNGYKLESTDSASGFHSFMVRDSKLDVHYIYHFTKANKCFEYTIWTPDKSAKETILNDLNKKYPEKPTETTWVQIEEGKKYKWVYQAYHGESGKNSFSFNCMETK